MIYLIKSVNFRIGLHLMFFIVGQMLDSCAKLLNQLANLDIKSALMQGNQVRIQTFFENQGKNILSVKIFLHCFNV